jgi:hypothetical protein
VGKSKRDAFQLECGVAHASQLTWVVTEQSEQKSPYQIQNRVGRMGKKLIGRTRLYPEYDKM